MRTVVLLLIGQLLAACGSTGTLPPNPEQGEIQYLTRENEALQRRINALEEEQNAYRESLAEAEKEAVQPTTPDEAQQRMADLLAQNEQLQARIRVLEAEQDAYRESLAEAERAALQASPTEDPAAQQRIADLEAERAGYRQSLEETEQQVAVLEQQVQAARQATPPPASAGQPGEVVATIPTDPHFITNSARLNQAGIAYMRGVAEQLKSAPPGQRFRVVGYTDDTPLSERAKRTFPSNWELSAARAGMLVRHLQWTHKMDPARFEVVGMGHYRPLVPNDTAEGRQANRVVRIEALN